MKLWFSTIMLVLAAAWGVSSAGGVPPAGTARNSSASVFLPAAGKAAVSAPHFLLQDMIQADDISRISCAWKRLARQHTLFCTLFLPVFSSSGASSSWHSNRGKCSFRTCGFLFSAFPTRAGPSGLS